MARVSKLFAALFIVLEFPTWLFWWSNKNYSNRIIFKSVFI